MTARRIVALVLGCLLMIPAIAVLFGGGALALGYAFGRRGLGADLAHQVAVGLTAHDALGAQARDGLRSLLPLCASPSGAPWRW